MHLTHLIIYFSFVIFLMISVTWGSDKGYGRTNVRQHDGRFRDSQSVVKVISTNTRSGFVNVDAIVNNEIGAKVFNRSDVPDNIYHGAVEAYGKVFDFILDKGILIEDQELYYQRNTPLWIDGEFNTFKTEKEFLDWLKREKVAKYTATSYRLADNNCLTFVQEATEFLGGKEPEKLRKQRQFAINNRKNSEVLEALYKAWKPVTDS